MVAAVVVIGKINQRTFVVKVEDWLNPDMYSMDAQDPYTGDTVVILKSAYKIGWPIDENGEPNYSFQEANYSGVMTQKIPRQPTPEEKKQLEDLLLAEATAPEEALHQEVKETVEHAYIQVFDSYVFSTIGYSGKVMVVVYDDRQQYTETFTWRKGGNLAQEVKIRS